MYNKAKAHEYYLKNKERISDRNRQWRMENPEKSAQHQKKYKSADNPKYQAMAERNAVSNLLAWARSSSKKYGHLFDLEPEDICIPTHCPYLGTPITHIKGRGRVASNASIDRKIPSLGYTKGNVQIISELANRMKSNATKAQLIAFAKGVLNVHSEEE